VFEISDENKHTLQRLEMLANMPQDALKFNLDLFEDRFFMVERLADDILDLMIAQGMKGDVAKGMNMAKDVLRQEMSQLEERIDEIYMFIEDEGEDE